MKPHISRQAWNPHLCYELPPRINTALVHPVSAPNGSTIIVYGHETGIKILWRGGKPLKKAVPPTPKAKDNKPKTNGTREADVIMIDDSDEDEPAPTQQDTHTAEETEFEEDGVEPDPSHPYLPIIQDVDIDLGTDVLHLAGPAVTSSSFVRLSGSSPAIFAQKIVLAAACSDSSIRVITLPLTPPSDSKKFAPQPPPKGTRFGEEVATLSPVAGHQSIPDAVTMTWTPRLSPNDEDDATSRPPSRSPNRLQEWDLLIGSHSADITGLLLLTRVPLDSSGKGRSLQTHSLAPWQTHYLSSPATQIAFNTSSYPSNLHSRLLIADSKGLCRVYDCLAPSHARSRSPTQSSPVLARKGNGAFVATFTSHFNSTPHAIASSIWKPILDAQWTSSGTSIIALLAGGQWGIWDVAGAGPTPSKPPPSASGFVLSGTLGLAKNISPAPPALSTSASKSRGSNASASFAPMTPNTRRSKETRFFSGGAPASSNGPTASSGCPSKGGITVTATLPNSTGRQTENVLIWHGEEAFRIANFSTFWAEGSHGGALFARGIPRVDGIDVGGERVNGVVDLAPSGPRDTLVVGERRLVILATEKAGRSTERGDAMEVDQKDGSENKRKWDMSLLLSRGELDLGAMDHMLDSMAGSGTAAASGALRRRVGFAT